MWSECYRPTRDIRRLSQFLAKYDPDGDERDSLDIYQDLVNNDVAAVRARISASAAPNENPWPWRGHHTAKGWLQLYRENKETVDASADRFRRKSGGERKASSTKKQNPTPRKPYGASQRSFMKVGFDEQDDFGLMQWLAIECPKGRGRSSINTYKRLVEKVRVLCWPFV